MFLNLEFSLPNKPLTPKDIGGALKGLHIKFWKEALFFQYDKNKNIILILAPIPIKSPPDGTKLLCSLIDTSIKEGNFSDVWKPVALQCENGSSHIQGVDLYQS